MEGSNNQIKWDTPDRRVNSAYLNGKYYQHAYECTQNTNNSYRFIRYVQESLWCEKYPYRIKINEISECENLLHIKMNFCKWLTFVD